MTARECGSVSGWLCAPARLVEVRLPETRGRFPGHRNNVGRTRVQLRRLPPIPQLIHPGIDTGPEQPVRGDDPIPNT
jgi:hypothetical protein